MVYNVSSVEGKPPFRNVPTNPKITNNSSNIGDPPNKRIYSSIHDGNDPFNPFSYTIVNAFLGSKQTLESSAGFKIKIYDSLTDTGFQYNDADWDDTNQQFISNDHFVLIHSEEHEKHHFAKITAILTDDVLGDSIEFSPPLGKEIEAGAYYKIFKGPPKENNIVAVSYGLKQNGH